MIEHRLFPTPHVSGLHFSEKRQGMNCVFVGFGSERGRCRAPHICTSGAKGVEEGGRYRRKRSMNFEKRIQMVAVVEVDEVNYVNVKYVTLVT